MRNVLRQRQLSFGTYLAMLGVVFAIVSGMEAFLLPHIYPPEGQQFLNGVAPKAMALLTGNGTYSPIAEPVRVATFGDLVGFLSFS